MYLIGLFSTSIELQSDNVCVCPKTLGQPSEVKSGLIMLIFGTLVDWMNTLGILIFENLSF